MTNNHQPEKKKKLSEYKMINKDNDFYIVANTISITFILLLLFFILSYNSDFVINKKNTTSILMLFFGSLMMLLISLIGSSIGTEELPKRSQVVTIYNKSYIVILLDVIFYLIFAFTNISPNNESFMPALLGGCLSLVLLSFISQLTRVSSYIIYLLSNNELDKKNLLFKNLSLIIPLCLSIISVIISLLK